MIKQASAITKEDYKKFIPFSYNEIINATNNWTWVENEMAAEINATNGVASYLVLNVGDVEIGDVVEIDADVLNVTGSKVKLSVDVDSGGGYLNAQYLQTSHGNNYQKCSLSVNMVKRGKARITIGLWTADVGRFKIRNVVSKKNSIRNSSINIRRAMITNKDDNIWKVVGDRPHDEVSLSVYDEYSIEVTFKNPLDSVGLSFLSLSEAGMGGRKFIARSSYESKNSFIVRFQDSGTLATGNIIKLIELTQPLYISILFLE